MKRKLIKIKGMHCKSCEILLEDSLNEINGVKEVKASYVKGIVNINFDGSKVTEYKIKSTIWSMGYQVE